jgi:hypothetical protein
MDGDRVLLELSRSAVPELAEETSVIFARPRFPVSRCVIAVRGVLAEISHGYCLHDDAMGAKVEIACSFCVSKRHGTTVSTLLLRHKLPDGNPELLVGRLFIRIFADPKVSSELAASPILSLIAVTP